jgi:thiol-disulfide isomerase/thioredoxin
MKRILVLIALVLVACGPTGNTTAPMNTTEATPDWRTAPFTDVTTGETFTINELDKPVLVESFAVWCPLCTKQQQAMANVNTATHVTLNTDPNEDPQLVRDHVNQHGFDWRFAVASKDITQSLINDYGTGIVHAPSVPVVLVCDKGARQLDDGVKSADQLREAIRQGC